MATVDDSGLIPTRGHNPAPETPSYLSIMLKDEKTIVPACRALEVSAAFPYARAHHQEPRESG